MNDVSGYVLLMVVGAVTAMLGVLLNLILGLSRVLLAMGRRRDMPSVFARVSLKDHSPTWSVAGVGVIVLSITLIGDIKLAWSFSAFTVLVYYSITNLAALKMPDELRRYPTLGCGIWTRSVFVSGVFRWTRGRGRSGLD